MVTSKAGGFEGPPAVVVLPMPETTPTGVGVVRCLGREGVPVVAVSCEKRPLSFLSRYVVERIGRPDPADDAVGFVEALAELGSRMPSRPVLFVTTDLQVACVNQWRAELEDRYLHPFLSRQALDACLNKQSTSRLAAYSGLSAPQTSYVSAESVDGYGDWSTFPAIVKPAAWVELSEDGIRQHDAFRAAVGGKAVRVANEAELENALAMAQQTRVPAVIQEEIPGASDQIFAASICVDRGGDSLAVFTARKTRQFPSDFGTGTMVESADYAAVTDASRELARAAGFWGVAEMEFKYDRRDGRLKVIEINPRAGTWISIAAAAGVNTPYLSYLELVGVPVPHVVQDRAPVKWIDAWQDWKYAVKYRSGDHTGARTTLGRYIASLRGRREYAYWSDDDPWPGMWRAMQIVKRLVGSTRARIRDRQTRQHHPRELPMTVQTR